MMENGGDIVAIDGNTMVESKTTTSIVCTFVFMRMVAIKCFIPVPFQFST